MKQPTIHTIDLLGAIAPITFLKAIQAFEGIDPGDILEILGNDSDTQSDILKVFDAYPSLLLEIEEFHSYYRIRIKKKEKKNERRESNGNQSCKHG